MSAEIARPTVRRVAFPLRVNTASLFMGGLLLVVLVLAVWPVGSVSISAFMGTSPVAIGEAKWGLASFRQAFTAPDVQAAMVTTIWLAAVRTVLAVALAIFLAWVIARTDTPGARYLELGLWIMFFLPFVTLAYAMLAGARAGLLNKGLMALPLIDAPVFNIYSYWGIIWVSVLTWAPVLTLFMLPAFRAMDSSLEESARMAGATALGTLRRITAPLLKPAILAVTALAFVRMVESFEVEALLGSPARIFVFTTRIFEDITQLTPPNYPRASAMATLLLLITFAVVVLQWRMLGGREYTTVTGRSYRAAPMPLGRWRYGTLAFVLLFLFFGAFLPTAMVILTSFSNLPGIWTLEGFSSRPWGYVFGLSGFPPMLTNSFIVSAGAATAGMVLYALVAYVVTRTQYLGRKPMDLAAWTPWAVPGIVLGLGFLWAIMSVPATTFLYQTLWVMILANIARGFPVGTRIMNSTMTQVSKEMEECARLSGATWTITFARIWLPLVRGGFMTGWIMMFAVAFRTLDAVILLYGAKTKVLSVAYFEFFRTGYLHYASVISIVMAIFLVGTVLLVWRFAPGRGMERTMSMR